MSRRSASSSPGRIRGEPERKTAAPSQASRDSDDRVVAADGGSPPWSAPGHPPQPAPDFDYTGKTDFRPGLACAPSSANLPYNCMLAWADRGVPNGRVLYTFLKVNTSTNQINWNPLPFPPAPNVYVLPSSVKSLAGVTLSFHAGKFWLAFKTIDLAGIHQDIGFVSLSSPYGSGNWSFLQYIGDATPVVDLPSWLSSTDSAMEAGLVWTAP